MSAATDTNSGEVFTYKQVFDKLEGTETPGYTPSGNTPSDNLKEGTSYYIAQTYGTEPSGKRTYFIAGLGKYVGNTRNPVVGDGIRFDPHYVNYAPTPGRKSETPKNEPRFIGNDLVKSSLFFKAAAAAAGNYFKGGARRRKTRRRYRKRRTTRRR